MAKTNASLACIGLRCRHTGSNQIGRPLFEVPSSYKPPLLGLSPQFCRLAPMGRCPRLLLLADPGTLVRIGLVPVLTLAFALEPFRAAYVSTLRSGSGSACPDAFSSARCVYISTNTRLLAFSATMCLLFCNRCRCGGATVYPAGAGTRRPSFHRPRHPAAAARRAMERRYAGVWD